MMRLMSTFCMLVMVSLFIAPAASAQPQPQSAPVSSLFQRYLESKQLPKSPAKSVSAAVAVVVPKSTGYIPSPIDYSYLKGKSSLISRPVSPIKRVYSALQPEKPEKYDLRTLGRVTPVRDQGTCGACWAFGSLASTESGLLPGESFDFSENNLKNTSGFDYGVCDGGNGEMALAYFSRWSGPVSETDDPYFADNPVSPAGLQPQKHIQEVLIIPGRGSSLDNEGIKQALVDYGAVTTSIYVDEGATHSTLSAYNPAKSSYYFSGASVSNHIVAIVGWDDTYSAGNFSTSPPGDGAFIVKNSWGTDWGNQGYFYISYYDKVVGRDNFIYTSATDPALYTHIYQYDSLGATATTGYEDQTYGWFANVFTATRTENLAAVTFNTNDINAAYEVYIYTAGSAAEPRSGTLAATFTGTIPYPGYHTLKVPTRVSLASGEQFSVVVKVTNPTYNYPIPLERPILHYSSQATAGAGQSFMSSDGTTDWTDVTTYYANTNVTLKAFTTQMWTVTTSSDSNGTVSCTSPVDNATNSSCIISPANGYQLATFSDTGVDMKSSVTGGSYTVANVTSNHTITATFSRIPLDGICGISNGGYFTIAPTGSICAVGTASTMSGTGPWSWRCNGTDGGKSMNCYALFGTAPASVLPPALVPQTGQTTCYDAAGSGVSCAGTGQNGELQSGVVWPSPRFVDNGDQTRTDRLTGLIWSKDANLSTVTKNWQEALDYIKSLNGSNYLGHNDWRLPNRNELKSLIHTGQRNQASWLNGQGFANVQEGYWTSSTYADSAIPPIASEGYWNGTFACYTDCAWVVSLSEGSVGVNIKVYGQFYYIWPVRSGPSESGGFLNLPKTGQTTCYNTSGISIDCSGSGQDGEFQSGRTWPAPRFTAITDQTQSDRLTGLIWSKNANPAAGSKTWHEALDYIKTLNSSNYLGYSDWRLPNRNELESLIHTGQSDQVTWLNGQGFSNVQTGLYWSNSTDTNFGVSAWNVSMNEWLIGGSLKDSVGYILPVRSNQQFWIYDTLVFSASPTFGTLPTGTGIKAREVLLGNRGSSSQNIYSIVISGAQASEFSISRGGSNPCATLSPVLEAGESCTFMLDFSPATSGVMNASLDITANGTTNSIPLDGTAVSAIYGTVIDQSTGLPVSGATVTLSSSPSTATTGIDGSYALGDLPAASYGITVSKTGYQSISRSGLPVTATTSAKADILLPPVGALNISSTTLPWTLPNVFYSSRVMVSGGSAPYIFSKPTGTLPGSLALDTATGIISGIPTGTGIYSFTIGVTDNAAGYHEKTFSIELLSPVQISTVSLSSGLVGVAYHDTVTASGGTRSYSFTLSDGTLPTGLSLNASTGVISGIPAAAGLANLTFKVSDYVYPTAQAASVSLPLRILSKVGDCDGNGTVTIAEVQSAINMFLGLKNVEVCVDQDGAGGVTIAEVQKTINSFLGL